MNNAQRINQDSGNTEIYTPMPIVAAARAAMGGIDIDVASSARANESIQAAHYFDKDRCGLSHNWSGRVWMNHPFSKAGNPLWINKLVLEVESGRVSAACCITYASTSEKWFQPLLRQPQCFLAPRTNYLLPDGSVYRGATKGSVVTYFGPLPEKFRAEFAHMGWVK